MRRMLTVIHGNRFVPSEPQREMVTLLVFNETPWERIALQVGCSMDELTYHFDRELNLSKDQLLAIFTRNIFDLANQRDDLGVALRANEMATRQVRAYQPPRQEPIAAPVIERVESLTEDEVDREIKRILGRQAAAEPADAQEDAARPEDPAD
jgi:hypothetical protein